MNSNTASVPCILCQNLIQDQNKLFHAHWGAVPFYHCQFCDIIFRDPLSWLNPEAEKKRYSSHQNTLENEGYVKQFDTLFIWLSELLENKFENKFENVLDYGCGPNPVLAMLMQQKNISNQAVQYFDPYFFPKKNDLYLSLDTSLNSNLNSTLNSNLKSNLNSNINSNINSTFDLVTMTEVFEHCYQPMTVIQSILQLLKNKGHWFVQTHTWSDLKLFTSWWYARDPTHVVFFSEKTWDWICVNLQLKLIKSDCKKNFLFVKMSSY